MAEIQYAKFISKDEIELAPNFKDGVINFNKNLMKMADQGYKKLVEVAKPIPADSHIEYKEYKNYIKEILVEPEAELRLNNAKELKRKKNEEICNSIREVSVFEMDINDKYCVFDLSEKTQAALHVALTLTEDGGVYKDWVTNNWVKVNLTNADIKEIYKKQVERITPLYVKELEYKNKIDACQTVEEVEAINLDYVGYYL